jgi:hypothetical protein
MAKKIQKQLRNAVESFFKNKPKRDDSDVAPQVQQQRSSARGIGVNPFGLRWTGKERVPMAMALAETSPPLPKDLRNEIIGLADKARFFQDFGIDMDTAKEIERALNHVPELKSAMDKFPSIVKGLLNGELAAPEHLRSIAEKIPSSPEALSVLKQYVETDTSAILAATTQNDRFKAASKFMGRLAAFGIKTN